MDRVFVGLGSNLDDPLARVAAALTSLAAAPGITLAARSRPYLTSPWGLATQPPFINAVAEVRSDHRPRELLRICQELERRAGRDRASETRWGPRPLDLDLLACGDLRVVEDGLRLPHPRLAERRFVLVPWAEIAPGFEVPGLGRVRDLLERCSDGGTVEPGAWNDR